MSKELKPCPWGGTECSLEIHVEDGEGNCQGALGCEYETDPWSGGSWYVLRHHGDCGAEDFRFGRFSSVDELIEAWNTRAERTCRFGAPYEAHEYDGMAWPCTECGYEFDEYAHECFVFCPKCGARVVD